MMEGFLIATAVVLGGLALAGLLAVVLIWAAIKLSK